MRSNTGDYMIRSAAVGVPLLLGIFLWRHLRLAAASVSHRALDVEIPDPVATREQYVLTPWGVDRQDHLRAKFVRRLPPELHLALLSQGNRERKARSHNCKYLMSDPRIFRIFRKIFENFARQISE